MKPDSMFVLCIAMVVAILAATKLYKTTRRIDPMFIEELDQVKPGYAIEDMHSHESFWVVRIPEDNTFVLRRLGEKTKLVSMTKEAMSRQAFRFHVVPPMDPRWKAFKGAYDDSLKG